MGFVEREILPRYNQFGHSHGMVHVQRVIKNALELVASTGADINMVYVIAAYHDLGMEGPRAIHHLTGGKMLAADMRLRRWFSAEQIRIMKEAVEDLKQRYAETVFARAIEYGLENYPELDKMGQWKRFDSHMEEKYSSNGYIKLWIPNSPNEKRIKNLREIIVDKPRLQQVFERIYTALMDK